MPRKSSDPIVGILRYFRDSELAAAKIALALAGEIVKERTPQPAQTTTKRRSKRTAGSGTGQGVAVGAPVNTD